MDSAQKRNVAWPVAFAVVAICSIVAVVFLLKDWALVRISNTVTMNSVIQAFLNSVTNEPKLVVLTGLLTVEVIEAGEATRNYQLFGKDLGTVSRGTTTVTLRADDNKFQYYLDLAHITPDDFLVDPVHKKMTFRIGPPILDEEFLDIQSDPGKIHIETDVGSQIGG